MKKVLAGLVAVAFVVGISFVVNAEEAKVKTKTTATDEGTKTVQTAKVKTQDAKEKVKVTTTKTGDTTVKDTKVTTKYKEGDVKKETIKTTTTTEGDKTVKETKIAMKPKKGDVKMEKVTIKKFNEHDPLKDTDNTITIIRSEKEVEVPVTANWRENHLKKFVSKEVTITSSYDPKLDAYIVNDIK